MENGKKEQVTGMEVLNNMRICLRANCEVKIKLMIVDIFAKILCQL
jgi:hypothetical protein